MFLRDFIRKLLNMKPLEPGKHELDFTDRTARIEPVLEAKPPYDHVEATAPKKTRKTKA